MDDGKLENLANDDASISTNLPHALSAPLLRCHVRLKSPVQHAFGSQ
ncbi:MAG: hypothetical protein HOK25_01735 [Rhodospirillaceae bacterium]|nr:hypothetical protein [Rhodospirillaceae bacterium]